MGGSPFVVKHKQRGPTWSDIKSKVVNLDYKQLIQISRAKGAISRYCKAVRDISGEVELKIFFVECGARFTVEYGDMDEGFYNALNLMY